MKAFELLKTKAKLPAVGLGTWQADPGVVASAVQTALDCGYRHIDCASVYANEKEIGGVFKRVFVDDKSGVKRDDVFVTSKLWNTDHSRVAEACRDTLNDLSLEYLDLYLVHWPLAFKKGGKNELDTSVTLEDTWKNMEKLVTEGLVKQIGVSNFELHHLHRIMKVASIQPAVLQVECHPYLPQEELKAYCDKHKIVMTAYSPLGSNREPSLLKDKVILEIAERNKKSAGQVLLSYGVSRGISVIPKSVTPSRIKENLEVFDLSANDMVKINAIKTRHRFINPASFWKIDLFTPTSPQ